MGGELFPLMGGLCEVVCFGVSVGGPVCWWLGLCSCLACCLGDVSNAAVLQAVEWCQVLDLGGGFCGSSL